MTGGRKLGLLGGTFDPVHYGHLDAADAALDTLGLDEVLFIPSHDPPHRPIDPRAPRVHRFALAALAVDERTRYRVSDIELEREGQSYTVDTLRTLHGQGWNALQLFFILGADAFAEIATWKAFPAVLDAAHFAVIARPGTTLEQALALTPDLRSRADATPATADVSTHTRILLVQAKTRDVSSTAIRKRITAGLSIDDLVPPPVARHILKLHLYQPVGSLHGEDAYKSR
jgi:nicotinate-nucleotide adenylyltransferase